MEMKVEGKIRGKIREIVKWKKRSKCKEQRKGEEARWKLIIIF